MSSSKIAIQIITYNGMKYLPYCLDSLKAQNFQNFEVFIIDNQSTDGTQNFIREKYPEFKLIENKENLGFAKAHNQGFKMSSSEYVMCLNQDMFLETDFIEEVVKFLDKHSRVGSLTGKIYRWDFENKKKTKFIDTVGLKLKKNYQVIDIGQGKPDEDKFNHPCEIFGVSGAAPIYRRQALEEIMINDEYFDQDFFMYKEDVDLAFRLNSAGWKAYLLPSAIAYHDRSVAKNTTLLKNRKQKSNFANQLSYRNHLLILIKNIYLVNLLYYAIFIFSYEIAKFSYMLLFETKNLPKPLDFFQISAKVLKKRNKIKQQRKLKASARRKWVS